MLVLVGLAFVVGVVVVLLLARVGSDIPDALQRRRLENRLKDLSAAPDAEPDPDLAQTLFKTTAEGMLPTLDRAIGGTARGSALSAWIEQSGSKAKLSSVLVGSAATGAAAAVLVFLFSRQPIFILIGFLAGAAIPFIVLKVKRTRRMHKFEEQFPEALDLIARALKAGHAFATGLKMAADELEEPVGPEFRKTFDEQNFGLPLKDALENLTHRMPSLDVRFFATAVLIQRETGGNLAEILENLAYVVRERFKILRQVRVYTAHGRLTGYVLLALPAFLSVALMFINPDHMNLLFRERIGQMLIVASIVMQTFGFLWIKQIVKIEV